MHSLHFPFFVAIGIILNKVLKHKAKRKRLEKWKRNHPPFFETLIPEVVEVILSFLDDARVLYNLSNMSKGFRNVIAMNPGLVVRTAVFAGGRTRQSVTEVMDLGKCHISYPQRNFILVTFLFLLYAKRPNEMFAELLDFLFCPLFLPKNSVQRRAIQTPSTFRLLRLVNGRRCERLEDCYAYDLIDKRSADVSKTGKRPFGLCICQSCVTGEARVFLKHYHFAFYNERIANESWGKLLCNPHREASTNELAGPLLPAKTIKQIEATYTRSRARADNADQTPFNAVTEHRKKALDEIIRKIDEDRTSEDTTRAELFVDAFLKAESEFEAFQISKNRLQADKWKARFEVRVTRKLEMARPVYERVQALLDGFSHKEATLLHDWEEDGICVFRLFPSQERLGRLFSAPSSASIKKVTASVRAVQEIYNWLESNGFLSTNFLSFLDREAPHELALYNHYQSQGFIHLLRFQNYRNYAQFFDHQRDNNPKEAFFALVCHTEIKEAFVAACEMGAGDVFVGTNLPSRDQLRSLATRAWDNIHPRFLGSWTTFWLKFDRSNRNFKRRLKNISDYLNREDTREFLRETGAPSRNPNQTFTRRDAVETLFETNLGENSLNRRNFADLLELHLRIFRNPDAFRFVLPRRLHPRI